MNYARWSLTFASLLLVLAFSVTSEADVFISGRIDMNDSMTADAPNAVPLARQLSFSNVQSVSYSNSRTSALPGSAFAPPNVNDLAPTIGMIKLSSATLGDGSGNNVDFNGASAIVAVFAFNPRIEEVNPGASPNTFTTKVDFEGAQGQIRIYDRSGLGPLNGEDPSTWVPNINNLDQGVLAVGKMAPRADEPPFYLKGAPGGDFTQLPIVAVPGDVNKVSVDLGNALGVITADFKFDILEEFTNALGNSQFAGDPYGPFFEDPSVFGIPPFVIPDELPSLLANIPEILDGPEDGVLDPNDPDFNGLPSGVFQMPDIPDLNDIFDAFMASDLMNGGTGAALPPNYFADGTGTGDDFVLPLAAQFGSNGDLVLQISGGNAIPGRQFSMTTTPEPASILAWCLVACVGACYGFGRWYR